MVRLLTQLLVLGGIAGIAMVACSSGSDCDFGLCAGTPAGSVIGPDGGPVVVVPDVDPPAGCNALADASSPQGLPCAANAYALFVDAAAGPDGSGTKEKPFLRISDAVAQVSSTGKRRVYVCGSAKFAEHVQLTTLTYANLYGGFDCASWQPSSGNRPVIAPDDAGYALQVVNVPSDKSVTIADFELRSLDVGASKDGTSSIAVFTNASSVAFVRDVIRAGSGAEGKAGSAGNPGQLTKVQRNGADVALDPKGDPATSSSAGGLKYCICSTDTKTSEGGGGGSNTGAGVEGKPKYSGAPGQGSAGGGGTTCATGGPGSDAPNAAPAAKGQTRGTLAADTGWRPTAGAAGEQPGEIGGGGGGGGSQAAGGYGGGGGCGGCGGEPGTGGGGGGASIAVMAVDGALTFSTTELHAANGGVGGIGGSGGPGKTGGIAGPRFAVGACDGGAGGRGGDGSGGAGGAGGLSVGVLYDKTLVNGLDAGSVHLQNPGKGGDGGKKGINDGMPGRAEAMLSIANVND